MKKFFALMLVLLLAMCLMVGCGEKEAEVDENAEWAPTSPVTVIVAYKAGSGTDNTARVLTTYAEKYVGQSLVIENLEGGSGSIGWTALVNAEADGYTIGFVNLPTYFSNIAQGGVDYTAESIVPICNHVNETSVILVAANSPFNTLEELVTYAQANPGVLKASTNGNQASNHIGAQLFASTAGFEYTAIPYGGTADQLLALRQGEVDFSSAKFADFASFTSEVKVLGVMATERMADHPEIPTLGELGYYDQWYGSARCIVAPAGTPQNVIDFYEAAFKAAMEDADYIAAATTASVTTDYMDAEALAGLLAAQNTFAMETVTALFPAD